MNLSSTNGQTPSEVSAAHSISYYLVMYHCCKAFFFFKDFTGEKKKTSYIRWKNFPPHKRDVVEGMKTKVPIRFYFNTRGRNTIICTNTKKMPARGALLITAALVGNISGETDVRDLLTKVFQTSAYNLRAIVNTAQKVNWAH